jgi:hypothetical protein
LAALHHLHQQPVQHLLQPVAAVIHLLQTPPLQQWSNAGVLVVVVVSMGQDQFEVLAEVAATTMRSLFLKQELHIP